MKQFTPILIVVILIALGAAYWFLLRPAAQAPVDEPDVVGDFIPLTPPDEPEPIVVEESDELPFVTETVIGQSVQGRDITAYHYGTGDTELLFVGGIHGGYEWNTVLVAYQLMDYLNANPNVVPANVTVTVIPVLNPDGLNKIVGSPGRFSLVDVPDSAAATIPGRYNANNVDLNRNFDCDWQAQGVWQDKTVSGGTAPFSEPESQAFRQYVQARRPTAVVVYYSAVGGVFASNCHTGILPETLTLTNLYADASGYKAYEDFDFYTITGDAVNWLAKNKIPGISVLLTTHEDVEWERNNAGVLAILNHYGS